MTDDLHGIDTALRERVADEHPDLDRLIRVSTDAGARLRRRRFAAASAGAMLASVAAVGIVAALSGTGGTPGSEAPVAADPTPPVASPAPSTPPDVTAPSPPAAPVRVELPGWQCDEPADEKFSCTTGAASVVVTWRPADLRVDYLDPDKADVSADVHTFVSKRHGPYFATVTPAPGTSQEQVDAVGLSLAWTD
jgi:hypothetical protein